MFFLTLKVGFVVDNFSKETHLSYVFSIFDIHSNFFCFLRWKNVYLWEVGDSATPVKIKLKIKIFFLIVTVRNFQQIYWLLFDHLQNIDFLFVKKYL